MASKSSPYPPSARRQVPPSGPGSGNNKPAENTPAGKSDTQGAPAQGSPEKDDPHWAPESGDKLAAGDKR
jgi:hypothetical protein